jgi:hypothetical protein
MSTTPNAGWDLVTACLEDKMIAREQARVWGGPDATAVGDMVCLDLIQGDEIALGGNTQLLIGRDVYSGYGFAVGLKNKQTDTIMTDSEFWGRSTLDVHIACNRMLKVSRNTTQVILQRILI